MVPRKFTRKQAKTTRPVPTSVCVIFEDLTSADLTALLAALEPATQAPPETACVCPQCGHQHSGYDSKASAVLDLLTLGADAVQEAKRLVEEEVLP